MCNNYEAQLQAVQDDMKQEQAKLRSLERESKAEKQTIESQKNYIGELEESLREAANKAREEVRGDKQAVGGSWLSISFQIDNNTCFTLIIFKRKLVRM